MEGEGRLTATPSSCRAPPRPKLNLLSSRLAHNSTLVSTLPRRALPLLKLTEGTDAFIDMSLIDPIKAGHHFH
uniref:Uncharacterized protein n=1 Tax=Oryza meridionalis TaxID=40149 RepID=A0A0E0DCH2_9ORYZ